MIEVRDDEDAWGNESDEGDMEFDNMPLFDDMPPIPSKSNNDTDKKPEDTGRAPPEKEIKMRPPPTQKWDRTVPESPNGNSSPANGSPAASPSLGPRDPAAVAAAAAAAKAEL